MRLSCPWQSTLDMLTPAARPRKPATRHPAPPQPARASRATARILSGRHRLSALPADAGAATTTMRGLTAPQCPAGRGGGGSEVAVDGCGHGYRGGGGWDGGDGGRDRLVGARGPAPSVRRGDTRGPP